MEAGKTRRHDFGLKKTIDKVGEKTRKKFGKALCVSREGPVLIEKTSRSTEEGVNEEGDVIMFIREKELGKIPIFFRENFWLKFRKIVDKDGNPDIEPIPEPELVKDFQDLTKDIEPEPQPVFKNPIKLLGEDAIDLCASSESASEKMDN